MDNGKTNKMVWVGSRGERAIGRMTNPRAGREQTVARCLAVELTLAGLARKGAVGGAHGLLREEKGEWMQGAEEMMEGGV